MHLPSTLTCTTSHLFQFNLYDVAKLSCNDPVTEQVETALKLRQNEKFTVIGSRSPLKPWIWSFHVVLWSTAKKKKSMCAHTEPLFFTLKPIVLWRSSCRTSAKGSKQKLRETGEPLPSPPHFLSLSHSPISPASRFSDFDPKMPQHVSRNGRNEVCYIDRSVLLENTPRVKFIRNYIRDPSGVFYISSQVRILMTSFPALSRLFVQTVGEKWWAIELSIQ